MPPAPSPLAEYERNVFINCPFDAEFRPVLNAILFCVVWLGFNPRIATERIDSGETRIDKIIQLIGESRLGIHDLSRSQAKAANDLARHNMPLELGIDLGCRHLGAERHRAKKTLILEEKEYRHQAAISDLSNSDIAVHGGDPKTALTEVAAFLEEQMPEPAPGPTEIWSRYNEFQASLFADLKAEGHSAAERKKLKTGQYLRRLKDWHAVKTA